MLCAFAGPVKRHRKCTSFPPCERGLHRHTNHAHAPQHRSQCSYVRFPRIFHGVEYGPKYTILGGLGLRRRSSVCRRPRPAAIPSPRTRARGRTVAGSSDVGLAQHTRGTGPGALRSSRKHVAARAFGGGAKDGPFSVVVSHKRRREVYKNGRTALRDERTINNRSNSIDAIASTAAAPTIGRRPREGGQGVVW